MKARVWTCRGCRTVNPRLKQRCGLCNRKRPAPRRPKHQVALDHPYEWWVEKFGEHCGICGRAPSARRRLDRDHCHDSGRPRGLLCARCNRSLPNHIDLKWLKAAVAYLQRSADAQH